MRYIKRALAMTSKAKTLTEYTTRALATKTPELGPTLTQKEVREGRGNKVQGEVL